MRLLHTSPEKITKITNDGLFDDCLFFAVDEYSMGHVGFVYEIDIDDKKIVCAHELDDKESINNIISYLDVTEDQAQELLNNDVQAGSLTGNYEDDWYVQAQQGAAAKRMGFEACESTDEQGSVYIVPMLGREKDLKII